MAVEGGVWPVGAAEVVGIGGGGVGLGTGVAEL